MDSELAAFLERLAVAGQRRDTGVGANLGW